jgi:hypothetical protein
LTVKWLKNHDGKMKIVALVFLFLSNLGVCAEQLFFKNGDILSGDVWRETKTHIILVSEHGSYKLNSDHLEKIEYGGKKRFRLISKSGSTSTIYPIQSNGKQIVFKTNSNLSSEKKISWDEVFALRIAK